MSTAWLFQRLKNTKSALLGAAFFVCLASPAFSTDKITLKDGFEIVGEVTMEANRIIVQAGHRLYFVGLKQLLKPETLTETKPVRYKVPQPISSTAKPVGQIARIIRVGDFDAFGRRTLVLQDPAEKGEVEVIQGITDVYATHVTLRGLNRSLRTSMALAELPAETLLPVLRAAVDVKSAPDRLGVADFLIDAGRFDEAKTELAELNQQFPEVNSQSAKLVDKLNQQIALRALSLAEQAARVGQWQRARKIAESLRPLAVEPETAAKVAVLQAELDQAGEQVTRLRQLVGKLKVPTDVAEEDRDEVRKALAGIVPAVSPATADRLRPLLDLAEQAAVADAEKIALALTGWALGSNLAQKDLAEAIRIWEARSLLLDALRTEDEATSVIRTTKLKQTKMTPQVVTEIVGRLPAPDPPSAGNQPFKVNVAHPEYRHVAYQVQLPPEYDPFGEYAAVITLHGKHTDVSAQLKAWGPQAAQNGFLVIAPEWREDPTRPYEYSMREHELLMTLLSDVRRRFAVDPDRIFLSGHELGGIAAWDFGMSHPDQFAGLVPFCGAPLFYCERYWPNLQYLPVYNIEGSNNFGSREQTQSQFLRYFAEGFNAVYVEYPGRGQGMFGAELPAVFDWMNRQKRKTVPSDFAVVSARHSDRRFYWVQADSFHKKATVAPQLFDRTVFRPARIEGKVSADNQMAVATTGLEALTVLVPPNLVHLDSPQLQIKVNRQMIHRGPLTPDYEVLIEEVRRTGDRKNLFIKRLQVPRL